MRRDDRAAAAARYASRNATASALPSSGSVAPPISSTSASTPGEDSSRIDASVSIEEENVERSDRIACASPISVRIARKTGTRVPASAAIGMPDCVIRERSPAVFEDDRLAARVRSRDDEHPPVGA